ncbi:FecR family protein [Chitinophaga polysaccharea]|uniref:FecR family protein n=1 Tax=Chitinophaga polysaccharea TaxID=1293035 RepID=A0A561PCD3_9BACT|nr:FecR family protein [Chitinophaga polysaccharea]TWF35782.1 FecR family protein [Chitinophaga polysaccharea]
MSDDIIWILLGKQASGEITAEELTALDVLLAGHPDAAALQKLVTSIWESPTNVMPVDQAAHQRIWNRVNNQARHSSAWRIPRRLAAAAAIVVVIGWTAWKITMPHVYSSRQQISEAGAGKLSLTLPDGSKVCLNHHSRLEYDDQQFGKKNREVMLTGEAFFEVAGHAAHPFIIHTSRMNITVLGTSFNVKAYATDSIISTTLISGKIAVSFPHQPGKALELQPNEKIIVPATTTASINVVRSLAQKDSSGKATDLLWLNNKLVFDNESFATLAKQMEQWYGVSIHFAHPSLMQLKFSGIIDTEPIEETLKALQLSRSFTFQVHNREVWIDR